MDWLLRDIRTGLRQLRRDRAYTLTATTTLALCLGANTALFSVVHHVLLRPLPVPEPDRVVLMTNQYPGAGANDSSNSGVPDYFDRLRDVSVYEAQALFNSSSVSLDEDGRPVRVQVMNVTPSYLEVMRTTPALGRPFTKEEGEIGNEKKVILSDSLWRGLFAADSGVVGKSMRLDGQPYTIVGVMPKDFQPVAPEARLFRPLAFTPEEKSDQRRHSNSWWNVARLKEGATIGQAQAQVNRLNAANLERFPQYRELLVNAGFRTDVVGFQDHLVRHVKPILYLLWGGVGFVLLIGCLNVANLSLVRARARAKEMATRLALGAPPWHIARQLVVENVMLTGAAAALGMALGAGALGFFAAFDFGELPYGREIALDGVSTIYALALALVIGLAMGLVPLATALGAKPAVLLRQESRSSAGGGGARLLRRALVVGQVAFTFVLLLGAGLLLASFARVLQVDLGFQSERVTSGTVALPRSRYADDSARFQFTDEALRRIRSLPGVTAAGATSIMPLGGSHNDSVILAEGYVMKPGESVISPSQVTVSPGFFEAMGVKLLDGRFFTDQDSADGPGSVIVDRKLARRFWGDESPVGRRMYLPTSIDDLTAITEKTVFLTVVGVVAEIKLDDITEGERAVGAYFFPMSQAPARVLTFVVKTETRDGAIGASLRNAIASLDPELPLFDLRPTDVLIERALRNRRGPAQLALSFGVIALLLSAVGLYGVLAYLVTQRTREIGIRLALGSSVRDVFGLVLREGVILIGLGFVVGGTGAFLLRSSLESQLFGVHSADPRVIAGVTLVLSGVALVACGLPARRATRINPREALAE